MRRRTRGRAGKSLTAKVIAMLGPDCYWCACPATTRDHWPIPHSWGGPDTLDNLVPACLPCNSARHDKPGPPPNCPNCATAKHRTDWAVRTRPGW